MFFGCGFWEVGRYFCGGFLDFFHFLFSFFVTWEILLSHDEVDERLFHVSYSKYLYVQLACTWLPSSFQAVEFDPTLIYSTFFSCTRSLYTFFCRW
jgi:hypothetical protein